MAAAWRGGAGPGRSGTILRLPGEVCGEGWGRREGCCSRAREDDRARPLRVAWRRARPSPALPGEWGRKQARGRAPRKRLLRLSARSARLQSEPAALQSGAALPFDLGRDLLPPQPALGVCFAL